MIFTIAGCHHYVYRKGKSESRMRGPDRVQVNYFEAKDTFELSIIDFIPGGGCGTLASRGNFIGVDITTHDTIRVITYCDYGQEWKIHHGDTLKVFKSSRYDTTTWIPVWHQFDDSCNVFIPRIWWYPYKTVYGIINYIEREERKNEVSIFSPLYKPSGKVKRVGCKMKR